MDVLKWDKDRLYQQVRERLGDYLFLVVSNREPYVHSLVDNKVVCQRPVSGLTEALDPVMRASGGVWVAQGSGDADKQVVDAADHVSVPPGKPEYTLRRVWMTEKEVAGFYYGFANEGLWPLCHVTFTRPAFRETDWQTYQKVNRLFADAILQEIGQRRAVVMVQDYHFALLPRYLKEKNPELTVGQFWHIPWPPYDVFRTCPWHTEILEGMLGNDLLGFHVPSFCHNFLEAAERGLESRRDPERSVAIYRGKATIVEPFPISIDFDSLDELAASPETKKEMDRLRREFHLEDRYVGLGMDRIDYTKGIPERLQALERFLTDHPEYRGKVVFIQAGMPSRTKIETYQDIGQQIEDLMQSINQKFGTDAWQPVIPLTRQLSPTELAALRRLADFSIVSSLQDGMNLVAKEYVAGRPDEDGVLILSELTGAAVEMPEALLVNPFDTGAIARRIKEALEMPEAERRRRMQRLRATVSGNNIYRWGGTLTARLIEVAGL
ncbi:MAG: trehalose-6-phosphate synthase [Chloroflexota bacterium]